MLVITQLACVFLLMAAENPTANAADTLLAKGSTWRFLDDGSDQGTAWRETNFDESTWPPEATGAGVLGFGDPGDQATTITNHNGGTSTTSHTWYFRHTFNVDDPSQYESVIFDLLRDDGAVVYLNGTEIIRSSMPTSDIFYTTKASSTAGGSNEDTYFPTCLDSNIIVPGDNVLAVEVHQVNLGSSDISFDLGLTGAVSHQVTRGPYLQNQTPESIVVRWRTLCPSDSRVRWGPSAGGLTNLLDGSTLTTEHEMEITGLIPGSTVFYSVGTTTEELAGNDVDHYFVMPPVHGTQQGTRVWVLGDSGTANSSARAVRDAYNTFAGTTHTDLWLMLGDNAYNNGTDSEYQVAVFDTYPAMLRKSVLWPTVGNHDDNSANSMDGTGVYYDIFTLPEQAASDGVGTGVDSGTEAYYSYDFANIHFIVLESAETNATFRSNMITWLAADLAATTAVWVVAFWHHPPYTMGSHNSDDESRHVYMRNTVLPILEAGGVDIELGGHSHSYERSWLIDGHYGDSDSFVSGVHVLDPGDGAPAGDGAYTKQTAGQAPNLGAVHVVAGSSGKVSGADPDAPHEALRGEMPLEVLGSVVLDVSGNTMDVTFLTDAGVVSDSFRLEKEYDADGVPDAVDNCPNHANPEQEDLNGDGQGNACDDDVDGDGIDNATDEDDDNDALTDVDEVIATTDPFDPDSDNDGIPDGLDTFPLLSDNLCSGDSPTLDQEISQPIQCAAPVRVIIESNTDITDPGSLRIVTPESDFRPGFGVRSGGELSVYPLSPPSP